MKTRLRVVNDSEKVVLGEVPEMRDVREVIERREDAAETNVGSRVSPNETGDNRGDVTKADVGMTPTERRPQDDVNLTHST